MKSTGLFGKKKTAFPALIAAAIAVAGGAPVLGQTWSATQRTFGGFDKDYPKVLLDNSGGMLHYVWEEWDATINLQVFTSRLDLGTGIWSPPVQRTTSLDYSVKPQFVLDSAAGKIYYVYQESVFFGPPAFYEIFTAEMNTDGTGWSTTQRTITPFDSWYPQLALDAVNGKIYYVYQEADGSGIDQLWTAEMNTDGSGWAATQRTFASNGSEFPQLVYDAANNRVHYVFRRLGSGGFAQVWTASLDLPGPWNTPIQRTTGNFDVGRPQFVLDSAGDRLHYVYDREDAGDIQIWTAVLEIAADIWSADMQTTSNAANMNPQLVLDGAASTLHYVYDSYDFATLQTDIWTAEFDLAAGTWSATPRTATAGVSSYPDLVLDPSRYAIRYAYQEEDGGGNTQVWTAELQYPSPTPTVTATPAPTPTPIGPQARDYVIVSNGGTSRDPGRTLSVIDPASNFVVSTMDCEVDGAVGWRPKDLEVVDGTVYVVCNDADRVFYGSPGAGITGYIDVGAEPLGIAVGPAGSSAYVTCAGEDPSRPGSGSVSVIDLIGRRTVARVPVGRYPTYGIDATFNYVALTSLLDHTLAVYDRANGHLLGSADTGAKTYPVGVLTFPAGPGRPYWAASLFGDGRTDALHLYDSAARRRIWRESVAEGADGGGPVAISLSARETAAVSLFIGDRVVFYNVTDGRRVGEVSVARPGIGSFSRDGRYFYVPSFRGSVHVIDTDGFTTAAIIPVGPNPVRALYAPLAPISTRSRAGAPAPKAAARTRAAAMSPEKAFREFFGK